ncbi:MAG: hypothetical protein ABR566_16610 [Pyrinomonadaceae bacterium]
MFIKRRTRFNFYGGLLYGFLPAAFLVLGAVTASAQTRQCKDGFCVTSDGYYDKEKHKSMRTLSISGFPRVNPDYATDFYQVRGIPGYGTQYEGRSGFFTYEGGSTITISVQACRRLTRITRRTKCTGWTSFVIY